MRILHLLAGVAAVAVSVLVARIVLHGFTDHGRLEVFHLVVAIAAAVLGLAVLYRALLTRRTQGST